MKKVVKVLVIVCIILAFTGIDASADLAEPSMVEAMGEYVISKVDDGYCVSYLESNFVYSDIGECLSSISNPSVVRFDEVTFHQPVTLPIGEYTICGKLYASGVISIPLGANVKARDLTLTLGEESYIRVKGGSLSIESSSILGAGQIIRVDYSSSSLLDISSGVISGESDEALINLENGRAVIRGADIRNKGGAAIRSDSELCIMGSPEISGATYGIILEAPMYMGAYDEEYYSRAPLSVQFMDTFSAGTLTEVFYEVRERSLGNVKLYDVNGKEENITYFEKSSHTTEVNFAGVYLPHTVKFYIGNSLFAEQKLLSGERIILPQAESIKGYSFDNWYRDRDGNDAYSSEKRVYSSFSLYGVYNLNAPEFGISSMDIVYDGVDHTLGFDYLSHPLDGGYYTYEWYKGDDKISDLSMISVRDVADSGIYSCRVTYNLGGLSASVYAENIKINIKKQLVTLPDIPSVKYSGLPQYPSYVASELYNVDVAYGVDAGIYPITVILKDPDNYTWEGISGSVASVSFEILKADNVWLSPPSASDSYIGFPINISATPLFGESILLYSATENGIYTSGVPTSAGDYFVKASVAETHNYTSLTSDPIPFSILSETVVGLQLISSPRKTEYFAFDKFDFSGMEVAAIYNSGRREVLSNSVLTLIYNDGNSLRVGDNSVAVEYLGSSLPISVSVSPLTYDLSSLNFKDQTVTYDGIYHTVTESAATIVGRDQLPLIYEITGGGMDVGEYTVRLKFSGASKDYIIPTDMTATLTVLPKTVDLSWTNVQFTYDSSPKIPSASFVDVKGVKREVFVCGSAILAGDGYTATATPYSDNYVFSNSTCQFSISKASYDMTSVAWSSSELVYNGECLEVTLQNLPEGVNVVGYTDNRAINVGKYIATASLKYDERNYHPPKAPSCEWSIKPTEYDMSSFRIESAEYEYDGVEHFPLISGSLPVGADGTSPSYTFTKGAVNVSDGEVTVTVTFTSESQNYIAPKSVTAKVKIKPQGIYVVWTGEEFIYDGNIKSPSAESPLAQIKVAGGKTNAGSYVASAVSSDPNYTVINSSYTYEIKKAENRWISNPTVSDYYESGSPTPSATPYFGKAEFYYYRDLSLGEAISPDSHGEYYMVATVPESENYLPLSSHPIKFRCIEVLPVDMIAEIKGELVAFSKIDNYLSVYLIYNDGTESIVPTELVSVKYQNGESLLCKDTLCEISYDEFTESLSITVTPATYDTSSVRWINTEMEYDGLDHYPIIEGLPEGISILSYIGDSGVSAGEYLFSVIISYDEENYLPPQIPDGILVINQAIVDVPSDISTEYSGKAVDVAFNSLYTAFYGSDIIDSGEYMVTYTLNDKDNYVFTNGGYECTSKVTVSPREIRVIVSNMKVYLFESDPEYSSEIDGDIADGDSLNLYYYIDGSRIYAKTDNKNYVLIVESGALEKIPYPNEDTRGKLLSMLLLFAAVIFVIIILLMKRGDILDSVYMLRARKKHRQGTGYINNAPSTSVSIAKIDSSPVIINISPSSSEPNIKFGWKNPIALSEPPSSHIPKISMPIESKEAKHKNNVEPTQEAISRDCDIERDNADINDVKEINDSIDNRECIIGENVGFESTEDSIIKKTEESASKSIVESVVDSAYSYIEYEDDDISAEETDVSCIDNALEASEDNEGVFIDKDIKNNISDHKDSLFEEVKPLMLNEPRVEIKMEYANSLITDVMARNLIKDEREVVYTNGNAKSIINVDTLSRNFFDDDRIDVNILKKKSLIPYDTGYIKVLARGAIDKPLKVHANEFSLSAVKMILLSGGEAIRVISEKEEKTKTKK